ncbi:MAG: hypothetical protein H7A49_10710 [Akkermansiaceae bacterium]|nr:hypothetical protein [Akkermansiaceae bacterium]MCP5544360.1 hypothetical protein [Akkermansiaceae bacterium]MCP5547426.1 hypothetical protein [Akkermansiaceae bacterium]
MNLPTLVRIASVVLAATLVSGCLTRRTVTQNGQTVEQNYVIKRPIKEAVERGR